MTRFCCCRRTSRVSCGAKQKRCINNNNNNIHCRHTYIIKSLRKLFGYNFGRNEIKQLENILDRRQSCVKSLRPTLNANGPREILDFPRS